MNKKQIKKVVKKNVEKVKVQAKSASADLEKLAMKEYGKIKKQMDTTSKKVESYVKRNPEKAAAISAGIGMALGAVAGLIAGSNMDGKKKKK
ncbi:MAG: hypothetical protein US57_C0002G0064 [Candidatus Moranbacteria bacterium GW2011_GWC2_37_73]|nr:MAG: hypothetical protein UR95_C0002G0161 [Parcubacteria group bacterium GW2011_GWC1_36_108]KKQ00426.1 MAG: hypothetical protein US09_C0012G0013 [Candidatus Moranbacteria bacterium GW2011_GWD1_36_198]KKQ01618.1 MAG: hypothetical protein US10_C0010G0003 [Candidatus Moranbacteria bacterium GW2011_GWD2_36_198]KKQ40357.1 MAG: hypothetical protein US57_C0002G0064 [Candidatus Moranbacteria bacterium GW2011_GWC2_37_73]HBI50862.1 hypothetical protein [Candidatus Moranbacteria bacterium]